MSRHIHLMKRLSTKLIIDLLVSFLVVCSSCSDNNSNNNISSNNTSPSISYHDNAPETYVESNSENGNTILPYEMDSIVYDHQLYLDCEDCSHPTAHYSIPRIVCSYGDKAVADSINNYIYQNLSVQFDDDGNIDSGWTEIDNHGVSFDYEINSRYLYIFVTAISYCAHGDQMYSFEALFDLNTGEKIQIHTIPFSALFSLKGYYDFLNKKNWTEKVKREFIYNYELLYAEDSYKHMSDSEKGAAMEEAESLSQWHKYYIVYSIYDDHIEFRRDCENHSVMCWAERCYEPICYDTCSLEGIKPYLNEIGEKLIFREKISSRLNEILWENKLYEEIEDYLFCEFSTDNEGKKIYKLAINYHDSAHVYGYLYDYNGNCEEVKGVRQLKQCVLNTKMGEIIIKNVYTPSINNTIFMGYADKNYEIKHDHIVYFQ